MVSQIVPRSFKPALETFHIKHVDDTCDGELMVPKVIVVVHHVVGRLLIDDIADTGQIDYLYDTLCDTGGTYVMTRLLHYMLIFVFQLELHNISRFITQIIHAQQSTHTASG